MWYEEKVINGVLHIRTIPRGRWRLMKPVAMTDMILDLRKKVEKLNQAFADLVGEKEDE